jgi:hypothetical protein
MYEVNVLDKKVNISYELLLEDQHSYIYFVMF